MFNAGVEPGVDQAENLTEDPTMPVKKKISQTSVDKLESEFTHEELDQAIKETSLEKAAGLDRVKNELLKNLPDEVEKEILILFNKIKKEKKTPRSWRRGRVKLLHKGKDKTDLGNYRPITLCSCLSKLFTKMLNSRLKEVSEDDGILPKEQVGFRKGMSGSYNIFTLLTAIEKGHSEGKHVNMTFIDIKKAYDTVNREILWAKMKKYGIPNSIIEVIKSMYDGDSMVFAVGDVVTAPLYPVRGLRQGCNLSPLLFLLYIAELSDRLNAGSKDISLNGVFFNHLLFADDIVLVTNSYEIMMELHKIFNKWTKNFKMQMSIEKSKVVSTDGHEGTLWPILGDAVDPEAYVMQQLKYKYLGVEITPSMKGIGLEKSEVMVKRAAAYKGAVFSLSHTSGDVVDVGLALWESIVCSSLLFGVECISVKEKAIQELDGIQASFAKSLLGVSSKSANVIASVELGLKTFRHRILEKQLTFYWRLQDLPDGLLVTDAFKEHTSRRWESSYIRDKLIV